jgi:hypothetical protein
MVEEVGSMEEDLVGIQEQEVGHQVFFSESHPNISLSSLFYLTENQSMNGI